MKSQSDLGKKRPYRTPHLKSYGDIRSLTRLHAVGMKNDGNPSDRMSDRTA